jgi:hypothetical protein
MTLRPISAALAALAVATACSSGGGDAAGEPVGLQIAPASAEIAPGGAVKFVALEGSGEAAVTWSVQEEDGGTVDSAGNYQAPDREGTFHVVASMGAGGDAPAVAAQVQVKAPAPDEVRVAVTPEAAAVPAGQTLALQAVVTGATDGSVTWSVEEGAAGGTVSAEGVYTAPAATGTYHVRATSAAGAGGFGRATVTVVPAPPPQFHVSVNGDDANPGTAAQPWRTIQKAMSSATPGSIVQIHGGTYRERLTMGVSGAPGKLITFQPAGFSGAPGCGGFTGVACGGDQVIVDLSHLGTVRDGVPFLRIAGKSHLRIQGITFQNYTVLGPMQRGVLIHGGGEQIEILHNKFLNNKNLGPWDGGHALLHFWVDPPTRNVTIRNNEFAHIWSSYGEALTTTTDGVLIEGNWMHDTDAIGMNIGQGSSNIVVRGNLLEWISRRRDGTVFYGNRANAIYVNGGATTLIENNVVRDSEWAYTVCSEPGYPNSHHVVIRNNVAYRTYAGVMLGNWYNSDPSPVYDVKVVNNTLHDVEHGFVIRPYTSATISWRNNLVSNVAIPVVNATGWATGTMAYNVTTSDARFVNAGAGDFRLQAGSPALEAGDPVTSADDAGSVDFWGNARFNGRIDAGAFEQ